MAGSIANDLQSADSRLIERDFHDFADEKLGKVVLEAGGKKREIVRQGDQKDFWARPDSADTKDETVSNWMSKIDRLRVTNYVEAPQNAPKPEDTVVRLEYLSDKGKSLGFLELVRQPPADPKDKTEYLARSERTRWYATVLRSSAEQIDLASPEHTQAFVNQRPQMHSNTRLPFGRVTAASDLRCRSLAA